MGYQVTDLSLEEAKQKAEQYPFGLVYLFDQILLGKTEKIKHQICWEDCMEARFFSKQGELHIFDYNGERKAVCVEENDKTDSYQSVFEKSYPLAKEFPSQSRFQSQLPSQKDDYKTFQVKEYLGCDEDGQVVVLLTRLAGLE